MAYRSTRQLSPGSRAVQTPGRISDSRVNDSMVDEYRTNRHNSYTASKTGGGGGGVVPISTETYVNHYPPTQASRTDSLRQELYSTSSRARTGSFGQGASTANTSSRGRPTIVQTEPKRPQSPQKDYYVTSNVSKEPRKKVYSVNDGQANLVAETTAAKPEEHRRHHRRRESNGERTTIRPATEKDRAKRPYHASGSSRRQPLPEKSIEDDDAYSYGDAPSMFRDGMFRDSEPSWRDRQRSQLRRNSVDRGSRERPTSVYVPPADDRRTGKDIGPPPSTRGWDKVNEMSRSKSVRETAKEPPQSPTFKKATLSPTDSRKPCSPTRGDFSDSRDPYFIPPRMPDDRRYQSFPTDRYDQQEYREARRPERRNSLTRASDRSVASRGFGIRSDSRDAYAPRNESRDRYVKRDDSRDRYGRASDEDIYLRSQHRDSAYGVTPPYRRETAPVMSCEAEPRLEQERRQPVSDTRRRTEDAREYYGNYERDERERPQQRDREAELDVDKERERERERMYQPKTEPERHHHHRKGSYREHDREADRKRDTSSDSGDTTPRTSSEDVSHPGLATAAVGGAAGVAAAAYGAASHHRKKHDPPNDRDRDIDPDTSRDVDHGYSRERTSPRSAEPRASRDTRTNSDKYDEEGLPQNTKRERHRAEDADRGLGFAFEAPSTAAPHGALPTRSRENSAATRDAPFERDTERRHADETQPDPDEEYRQRMAQFQRELGRPSGDRTVESDPDRERRRREREQRLRDRDARNEDAPTLISESTYASIPQTAMPDSFEVNEVASADTGTERTLRRMPSILDEPMTGEPAQIIDNSLSDRRENRVRIVDPPTAAEEEEKRPKGILKKPKEKFPDYPDEVREGVAPLKDVRLSSPQHLLNRLLIFHRLRH